MIGSTRYQLQTTAKFDRSLKALTRRYRKNPQGLASLKKLLADFAEELSQEPRRKVVARPEPWPKGSKIKDCELWKLSFRVPGEKGAAQQGRLIYLIDETVQAPQVMLIWIYTHADFSKRPSDKDLLAELSRLRSQQPASEDSR